MKQTNASGSFNGLIPSGVSKSNKLFIAIPVGANSGKTLSLKELILCLSGSNQNSVTLVKADKDMQEIINKNPNNWLNQIIQSPINRNTQQFDISVTISVQVNGKSFMFGISTNGDTPEDIENYLCCAPGSDELKPQFQDCDVIISASRPKRSKNSFSKLQDICRNTNNTIWINNVRV